MTVVVSCVFLVFTLPSIFTLFTPKYILCNQSIPTPTLDLSVTTNQNLRLNLCNDTFNILVHPNDYFFSRNVTIDRSIKGDSKRAFTYLGQVVDEDHSTVSVILYPQLQIYIYVNDIYYYYLSLSNNSSIILRFSPEDLLQSYPQLVNDNFWKMLQQEEDFYQKGDLHFIYELLTLRCESDQVQSKTISFCSLALFLDQVLYQQVFDSNIYYVYTFLEHFNFLLRTLTRQEYGGFLLKQLSLINHIPTNINASFDLLHNFSNNINFDLKDYCLAHQMLLTRDEKDTYVLGYQSSVHTYDIGGICSTPIYANNNNSEEMNLNTGLSVLNENVTRNLSMFFNGLMKTSYLFFRQMGLNLTLCSINTTRRGFFQFNSNLSPVVQQCLKLVPVTLEPALKRRAHLCFNHLNMFNASTQPVKQQITCKESIDLQSSVMIGAKHRKSPYIENALNNNRPGQWFEGNIVGMILSFSLLIWIPVSCFVHFCVDEINKKSFIEKQQQEMEALSIKTLTNEQPELTKQTQTD